VFPFLSAIVFLPAAAGAIALLLPREKDAAARAVALGGSAAALVLALAVCLEFEPGRSVIGAGQTVRFQFEERADWIPSLGISYKLGIDGISLFLVVLTAVLTPITVLASWRSVTERVKEFHASLLFLEAGILGVFMAMDLALFYVFWEVMLIPMILLIGIWGSGRRVYAAVKFFLYTMVGSLLMLLAILYLYLHLYRSGVATFDLAGVYRGLALHPLPPGAQLALFLAFALAFAIKVPLFPFHTWLPDAHTEAPTAGSVILAGVLLKMGTYGFVRFAIPFFPWAASAAGPWIVTLAVVGIIYGACMCMVQDDLKRLIAYSSVSHLGFVMLGIFALNAPGLSGGIYQMLNHGVSTGALFLLVGAIYERTHTRRIADYGGFAAPLPRYAAVFLIVLLSSIGLPGLNGFVGEFWILLGAFQVSPWTAALAATGVVLGAVYLLTLYQRMMLGRYSPAAAAAASHAPGPPGDGGGAALWDLDRRELSYFIPLIALMVVMGLGSTWFTDRIDPAVRDWLELFGRK
jgi:NADH-quinone oxidoreductase subunit M